MLNDHELAAIARRVDAHEGPDHYRYTIDGIGYDGHWAHDTRRLLAEVDRLRAENTAQAEQLGKLPDLDTIRRIEKERGTWGMQLSEARREIAKLRAALGLDQDGEGQANG